MDRKGIIAVVVCMVLMMAWQVTTLHLYPPPLPKALAAHSTVTSAAPTISPLAQAAGSSSGASSPPQVNLSPSIVSAPVAEQLALLENDAIKVTITSRGAAVKEVDLKQHKDEKTGMIVLNEQSHSNVLELTGWPGTDGTTFTVQELPPRSVVYSTTLTDGVKWTRTYVLGKDYVIDVKDTLINPSPTDMTLPAYSLSLGRAEPLRVGGHYQPISNQYLGSGWLAHKFHLITVNDFNAGSFFGISTRPSRDVLNSATIDAEPVHWLGVENQFFAMLLTPTADRLMQRAEFRCLNTRDLQGNVDRLIEPDIEATGFFPEVKIPATQTVTLAYTLYSGPKEFGRLETLGDRQGELMNYGVFVFIIRPMLAILHFFYSLVHSYGLAIILLTLVVKGCTWPLQSIANRSGKRMQALAPKLKELQAKYKDQPEKLQTETFGLYRDYGVNPFGGCLPALVQMPVFFSLYFMLQNAVELRGQSFLWVHDLTQPDTIASVTLPFLFFGLSHLALNPLPLMVTGLTMVMMRMTPQIGDPQQAKIAQFMPLVFLFIFYNFAAALSLYYVINNCVSIIQIYRNLRKPMPELKRVAKK